MTRFCNKCGSVIDPNARFCGKCGAEQVRLKDDDIVEYMYQCSIGPEKKKTNVKAIVIAVVCVLLAAGIAVLAFVLINRYKNRSDTGSDVGIAAVTTTSPDKSTAGTPENNDVRKKLNYTVGICQLVDHPALNAATQGFQDALVEKLGDRVTFDVQNASGDINDCVTIVSRFVNNDVDLIMANASPALTAAVEATSTTPIVATSVTDYAAVLGLNHFSEATGINVTGTTDITPPDQLAAMVKELVPKAKTVGVLYCSAEANSKYQADVFADELAKFNIVTKDFSFADINEIAHVAEAIKISGVDCVYIPVDNTVSGFANVIENIIEPAGIPVIAGEESICRGCGVATISIDYYDLGYAAGEMAYEILVNGADPATMPIQYLPADKITKKYIADRAAFCGIRIPGDYVPIV